MNEENKDTNVSTPDFSGEEMKMPENAPMPEPEKKMNTAPILIGLTVLLLIILGGLYYWFSMLNAGPAPVVPDVERPTDEENNEPESTTAEAERDNLDTVSSSDELSAIEADLESTNLESLDAELNAIEAELEASGDASAGAQ